MFCFVLFCFVHDFYFGRFEPWLPQGHGAFFQYPLDLFVTRSRGFSAQHRARPLYTRTPPDRTSQRSITTAWIL